MRLRVRDIIFYLMAVIAIRYVRSAIFILFIDLQISNSYLLSLTVTVNQHGGFFPYHEQLFGSVP